MSDEVSGPVIVQRKVRFGDCDPAGIVFTPQYGRFVFDATEVWLEQVMHHAIHHQLETETTGMPVRSLTTDLYHSLRPADHFRSTVYVEAIGNRSFRLLVVGHRADGTLSFAGRMTCVTTDRTSASHRSAPMSERIRDQLTHYQQACGPIPEIA